MTNRSLLKSVVCAVLVAAALGPVEQAAGAFYTCDDIVTGLCPKTLKTTEGVIQIRGLPVHYWVYEDPTVADSRMVPLVTVHGGPGLTSDSFVPLKQLACRGRKVIRYTQAGMLPTPLKNVSENAAWLLTVPYYLEELQTLVDHLGLEQFHLLGHSWGTIIGQEYAVRNAGSKQLVSLLLVGALSDPHYYNAMQRKYLYSTLPPFTQNLIEKLEAEKAFDSELWGILSGYVMQLWTVRMVPPPDCVEETIAKMNPEIAAAMLGRGELHCDGVLKTWNITGELHRITVPTVVIHGKFDTMVAATEELIASQIKGARVVELPRSGHLTMIDEADLFNDVVEDFLETSEGYDPVHRDL